MHKLKELKEKLIEELEDYAENGKFSEKDVESIKYMTSAVDHLCNIIEDYDGEEYSNAYMYDDGMSYARGGNRGGRGSYARGRGRNAKRDSMGRYSSEGYSRAMDDMSMEIRRLMNDAPNDQVKQEFQRFLTKIESM